MTTVRVWERMFFAKYIEVPDEIARDCCDLAEYLDGNGGKDMTWDDFVETEDHGVEIIKEEEE